VASYSWTAGAGVRVLFEVTAVTRSATAAVTTSADHGITGRTEVYLFGFDGAPMLNDRVVVVNRQGANTLFLEDHNGNAISTDSLASALGGAAVTVGRMVQGPPGGLTGAACTVGGSHIFCAGGMVGTAEQTSHAGCQAQGNCERPPPYGCGGRWSASEGMCGAYMNEQVLVLGSSLQLVGTQSASGVRSFSLLTGRGAVGGSLVHGKPEVKVMQLVGTGTWTATTEVPHGFSTGDIATVDGDKVVLLSTPTQTTFTFAKAGNGAGDVSGNGVMASVEVLHFIGGQTGTGADSSAMVRVSVDPADLSRSNAGVAMNRVGSDDATTSALATVVGLPKVPREDTAREYLMVGGRQNGQVSAAVRTTYMGIFSHEADAKTHMGFAVSPSLSSSAQYAFQAAISPDAAGSYSVCVCDAQEDITDSVADTTSGTSTGNYQFYDGLVPANGAARAPYGGTAAETNSAEAMHAGEMTAVTAADLCYPKCAFGCSGATCFCDGYLASGGTVEDIQYQAAETEAASRTSRALCLDAVGMQKACEAEDDCDGYIVHRTLNRGFLLKGLTAGEMTGNNPAQSSSMGTWRKTNVFSLCRQAGKYYGQVNDFVAPSTTKEREMTVGTLHITQRADVGVDYVVQPREGTSLEVTGNSLSYLLDRIMVIDCQGICGVSEASTVATRSPAVPWEQFDARNAFLDRPSLAEDIADAPPAAVITYTYAMTDNTFCPSNNIQVPDHPEPLVVNHQCYKKCFAEAPCVDANCFCEGHHQGYDRADSDALCLDQRQCTDLCSLLPDCTGVDMHRTLPRCFLNTHTGPEEEGEYGTCAGRYANTQTDPNCAQYSTPAACDATSTCAHDGTSCNSVGTLTSDVNYKFLWRSEDQNSRQRRLRTANQARALLAATDPGTSWESILRFSEVTFSSGGTFKLCLCDAALLGSPVTGHYFPPQAQASENFCSSRENFVIEVGEVHSSGLQCLLGDKRFQRGTCEAQMYGGLRCYSSGVAPAVTVPNAYLGVPSGQVESAVVAEIAAFCRYGPAAETAMFPYCAKYQRVGTADAASTANA